MTEEEIKGMEEIYAEMDADRLHKETELTSYRSEFNAIQVLLDSYLIPKVKDGVFMTLAERIDFALKERRIA